MNRSIVTVVEKSANREAIGYAAKMIANEGKRCAITFIKKDGTTRHMVCVPRNQYNTINGITSTISGCKMVKTKAHRDMVTVSEIYTPEGTNVEAMRPRTINLSTITGFKVLPM